ncbi:hypothetical protein Tsubulata_043937 [Turnera subulata]|uniref:Uncharacterized protein n=1 Tax=Turnera subulata TaxID=218843 RepID=A0A9Q0FFB8_9ROSI|nr:hypothetical protein Tsubulata_043937 [Turnera subulata]
MSSVTRFSYQKLKHEDLFDELEGRERLQVVRRRSWFRFRRVHIRKRFRLRVPGLRKLTRKRVKLVSAVRLSYAKVLKRFKEGQGHFSDLFAGNYMFLQINPTSLKQLEKSYYGAAPFNLHSLSSRYAIQGVAQ